MATAAQIQANRLNAQHSTGPRTLEGKQRASANSLKNGYCATRLLIRPERQAAFDAYYAELLAQTGPVGLVECEHFKRLLLHGWNLNRIRDDETALVEAERDEANARQLLLLARYRRDLERSYDRALKALRELQTDRVARVNHPYELVQAAKQEAPLSSPAVLPNLTQATYGALLSEITALGDVTAPRPLARNEAASPVGPPRAA
jgi:hypothetical protein